MSMVDFDGAAFVKRFMDVFNNRDPEGIAAMMADDAILEASFGREPWGMRVVGPVAIRDFYVEMFARTPDAHWDEVSHSASREHVVVESMHTATPRDGPRIECMICDVLTLRDGKIAAKRSYRKVRL
jgi:ketosteroid isomerase-like protein